MTTETILPVAVTTSQATSEDSGMSDDSNSDNIVNDVGQSESTRRPTLPSSLALGRRYSFKVTKHEDDKADEIKILDFSRPHGRAFYCGILVTIVCFMNAFAITPLLSVVRDNIEGISQEDLWTSSICNIILNCLLRLPMGSLADKYGPRILIVTVLCFGAIPTACTGFIQTGLGLSLVRLFSGITGALFVVTQSWANSMFSKRVVGSAISIMGSNIETGFAQLFMGTFLFPVLKNNILRGNADLAWRIAMVVPALLSVITGIAVYRYSDDTPKGNYTERKRNGSIRETGTMAEARASVTFQRASWNRNTWVLMFMYAYIVGSEIALINAMPLYYKDKFGQSTASAAAIASISGFVAPIGTSVGGAISDVLAGRWNLRGRILLLMVSCILMGSMMLLFCRIDTISISVVIQICIALLLKVAAASLTAVLPFVDPKCAGSVVGIVSSGVGPGSVAFMFAFRQMPYSKAFDIMGLSSVVLSMMTILLRIQGYSSFFPYRCPADEEGNALDDHWGTTIRTLESVVSRFDIEQGHHNKHGGNIDAVTDPTEQTELQAGDPSNSSGVLKKIRFFLDTTTSRLLDLDQHFDEGTSSSCVRIEEGLDGEMLFHTDDTDSSVEDEKEHEITFSDAEETDDTDTSTSSSSVYHTESSSSQGGVDKDDEVEDESPCHSGNSSSEPSCPSTFSKKDDDEEDDDAISC